MSDEVRERAAVEHDRPGAKIVKARDIAVPLPIGTRMWYDNTTHVPVKTPTTFRDDLRRSTPRGCAPAGPARRMRRRRSSALSARARRFYSGQGLGTACGNVTSMGEHRCFHDDLSRCESVHPLHDGGGRLFRRRRERTQTRSARRASQTSQRRLVEFLRLPRMRPARARSQTPCRQAEVLAVLSGLRGTVSQREWLAGRARRCAASPAPEVA